MKDLTPGNSGTDPTKGIVITETHLYPTDHSGMIKGGSVKDYTGPNVVDGKVELGEASYEEDSIGRRQN